MKILIVSDTHGYENNMWRAIKKEEPIDEDEAMKRLLEKFGSKH